MKRFRRALLLATVLAATAGGVSACGQEGISVPSDQSAAADIFKENCSGCHTLSVAGTQGSTTNIRTREYKDGPNFDQRHVSVNCALYAIRNGGFSSGPMPQNIITGEDARMVAEFLEKYSKPEVVGGGSGQDCPATE
ncbi:c-type cytochrome [Solirubrobacter sp. CPCC 204708]|uniref:Cytochrome c n=1 Tax=Solirubrobacter deserti TaxID=2282478 RepID=A0ABT4REQ2_9ACTN|nr:c-type cytochrome [Solirubrobacter deserti]MBE2318568.1 c-type cytochrome [Solirubrobacter deserti]MDA0137026.1 cytochrome c [Solirubrobacter deserti]